MLASRAEYHPKRHGFAIVAEELAPIPVQWRLLLGDVANNCRASLDHLAWALVCRGRTPPGVLTIEQERAVYFPILQDRRAFNGELRVKLPGARRADIAKVRRYQPYHNGPSRRSRHVLSLLAGINRGDKHRTIQPLWAVPTEIGIEVTEAKDCIPGKAASGGVAKPLNVGTDFAFVHARKTGENPELQVKLNITAEPSLDNVLGVKEWTEKCAILVFKLLAEFSTQPPEIWDIGGRFKHVSRGEVEGRG